LEEKKRPGGLLKKGNWGHFLKFFKTVAGGRKKGIEGASKMRGKNVPRFLPNEKKIVKAHPSSLPPRNETRKKDSIVRGIPNRISF